MYGFFLKKPVSIYVQLFLEKTYGRYFDDQAHFVPTLMLFVYSKALKKTLYFRVVIMKIAITFAAIFLSLSLHASAQGSQAPHPQELIEAAGRYDDDIRKVKKLLENGADINKFYSGQSALMKVRNMLEILSNTF